LANIVHFSFGRHIFLHVCTGPLNNQTRLQIKNCNFRHEKKKWSKEEKLAILKEAAEKGVEVTIRLYGIYPSTFYTWRKKYQLE
jgi:transposase-like protein